MVAQEFTIGPRTFLAVVAVIMTGIVGVGTAHSQQNNPLVTAASPTALPSPQFQARTPLYRLHKSDVIEVEFTFSPEFNQTLTIQPDGYITLKGVGEVPAEDKTIAEVTKAIAGAYHGILHEPVITVALKEFDRPYFLASGEVGKPGKYELKGDTTLSQALAIAGGFTGAAKHSQVVLFRRLSSSTVEARVFNVKRMLKVRNLDEDPHINPGDMLYVPQNTWSKVRRYLPSTSMGVYATPNPF